MTRDEFEGPADLLDRLWPGDFTDKDATAFHFVLEDFPADTVLSAVKALVGQSKYRPTASEVAAVVAPHGLASAKNRFAMLNPGVRSVAAEQRKQEIEHGLRWPDGREIDYERDEYFQRHPLALTLPPEYRGEGDDDSRPRLTGRPELPVGDSR